MKLSNSLLLYHIKGSLIYRYYEFIRELFVQSQYVKSIPGLPEIDLAPLDPLKVPKIRILQGDGPVNVNAALDDVTVSGFGHTEVLKSQ